MTVFGDDFYKHFICLYSNLNINMANYMCLRVKGDRFWLFSPTPYPPTPSNIKCVYQYHTSRVVPTVVQWYP